MNDYQPRHRDVAPEPPLEAPSDQHAAEPYDPPEYDAPYGARHAGHADDQQVEYHEAGYQDPVVHETPFHDDVFAAEHHHHHRRGARSVVAAVIALVVIVGGLAFGGTKAYHYAKDHLGGSGGGDYAATDAHGSIAITIRPSESGTEMARELKSRGVVKSVDAFINAYNDNSRASKIAPGTYKLQLHMPAAAAVSALLNRADAMQTVVPVPEGARVAEIITLITQHTNITRSQVVAALADPRALGLPATADGNPEGFLFPATYTVTPGETATELLRQMVSKAIAEYQQLGLATGAARLGLSERQLITVASILEYEAKRPQDYPKVARAIYNRLARHMPLQSDATVSYANGVKGEIWTTSSQRASGSPYNTYQHTGLPPGPIGSPGETTLDAAMNPAHGPWLYWVVVNLKTGQTVFSSTLAGHNKAVAQFQQYCRTSSAC